jgi:hemoglobin/transferrin/lactoferrin receptor protein
MRVRKVRLATTALTGLTVIVTANGSARAQDSVVLDAITVTASKAGERVYDSLSGSSVLTGAELERTLQPGSTADVLRLVPNVTTQSDGSDPGMGVNIRGLQDFGRVNVLVDGARQNFAREGHRARGQFYFDP